MANIYKNEKTSLTTTALTTLYTVPSNSRAIVKSLIVHNDSGAGADFTLDLIDASAASFAIYTQYSTTARTTYQLLSEPLILQESEILKVTASVADRLIVIASILEINREDR